MHRCQYIILAASSVNSTVLLPTGEKNRTWYVDVSRACTLAVPRTYATPTLRWSTCMLPNTRLHVCASLSLSLSGLWLLALAVATPARALLDRSGALCPRSSAPIAGFLGGSPDDHARRGGARAGGGGMVGRRAIAGRRGRSVRLRWLARGLFCPVVIDQFLRFLSAARACAWCALVDGRPATDGSIGRRSSIARRCRAYIGPRQASPRRRRPRELIK
jgi:hypothetical protein